MEQLSAGQETTVGTVLVATAYWADALHTVSAALTFVTLLCGAIIGAHGVFRIIVRYCK